MAHLKDLLSISKKLNKCQLLFDQEPFFKTHESHFFMSAIDSSISVSIALSKTSNSIFPEKPSAKNETTNNEEAEVEAEEDAGFDEIYKVPFKIIAMFVGELDYGALPFNTHQIFNYVTFVLFVYLVVLVMMNLLTGVALTDVEELKNESGDTTWHEIMLKINFIDEVCRNFSSAKMLAYPNCKTFSVYPNRQDKIKLTKEQELTEISTAEQSIVDAAHKIVQKRHQSEEANVMRDLGI